MRIKKAGINAFINVMNYVIMILPNFFIRKIFLEALGAELLGLNSLYQNIVGFLCISELGLSLAISHALYKPVAENNRKKIKGYIQYYISFYRKVSIIIFSIGLLIVPILHIFTNGNVKNMRFYFVLFLVNTCITYLFSAKFCILSVNQENYVITTVQTIVNLLMAIGQIVILYVVPNYTLFIVIQIVSKLIQMCIINRIIYKKFGWLKDEKGELEKKEVKELFITMKGLFFHKISAMVLFATDNIVISSFLNLVTVAKFGNYYLVISGVQSIVIKFFDGITASVGNLLTENNKKRSYEVFNKLFFMAFIITSTISICVLNNINKFIDLWVGREYRLDLFTVILLVMNFYFLGMRLPIEKFKETAGMYYEDRYWAVGQAVINLVVSIIMVNIIGLPGVFLGTFISNYCIEFWIKPKLVYKKLFDEKLSGYFKLYFKYLAIAIGIFVLTNLINLNMGGILGFIVENIIDASTISISYLWIFRKNLELKYFKDIFIIQLKKKQKKAIV